MIKEEAIKILEEIIDEGWLISDFDKCIAIDACEMAIKALEQEPRKDEVILTKEEYGELVSNEFDNGYAKGYREGLEQEPILDKIKEEIEAEYGNCYICEWYEDYDFEDNDISEYQQVGSVSDILEIIDKYKTESEGVNE